MLAPNPESGSPLVGVIVEGVTGISNTILDWMGAFCATEKCDEDEKNRQTNLELAELARDTARTEAVQGALALKSAQQMQKTLLILGGGALGVAALYIVTR